MTQFIELTAVSNGNPINFHVNISKIETISESLISNQTLIYIAGKSHYVTESRQQILGLITEAQQEQPYRTK